MFSLILSAPQIKQLFKLLEHLQPSMLIMSAQCILWKRYLPHFSQIQTNTFAVTFSWIWGSESGNVHVFFFSFTSWIFNNFRSFYTVIGDLSSGKFYWLVTAWKGEHWKKDTASYHCWLLCQCFQECFYQWKFAVCFQVFCQGWAAFSFKRPHKPKNQNNIIIL